MNRLLGLFLLIGLSFSSTASEGFILQGEDKLLEDRFVLDGEVRFGQYLNCQVFNETQNDLQIQRYVYEVWVRTLYGHLERQTQLFHCVSGCYLESFGMVRLSGPSYGRSVVRASCKALVKRVNWDDGNDDDFNLRRPMVFDRWN